MSKKALPAKSNNLADWYNRVVLQAELADYGPAKGTMIFRPYGFAIWEEARAALDQEFKSHGVENAYFPIFIPEKLLKLEKDHVKGFSPELAVVTYAGGEELTEKLVVRPTSETIMYEAYSRWIQSWRDLPVMINQWNNAVRWEKRTYLFLRTSEFLWQEGHTAHAEHDEAKETVQWAIDAYARVYRELFALPGYLGRKSETEKFAGALESWSYETLMPEGKALQSSTSHDLGQNFAKPFEVKYQDKSGQMQYVWQTSWGFSTRSLGGLVMAHGDDNGLVLPPRVAPVQVVVLPVRGENQLSKEVVKQLTAAGLRVKLDERDDESLGYKINKWELKGVPLRLEIGQREVEDQAVMVVRRDTGDKQTIATAQLADNIAKLLEEIQSDLLKAAEQFLADNTHDVEDFEQFKSIMTKQRGFIRAFWCEDAKCEAEIKAATKATTRCLERGTKPESGQCVHCGGKAKYRWLFAQAY